MCMGMETADSHKLSGKGQIEAEAQERFVFEKKERRLAKNRATARQGACGCVIRTSVTRFEACSGFVSIQIVLACVQGEKKVRSAVT